MTNAAIQPWGPCPPAETYMYAVRFRVPVIEGFVVLRSSVLIAPRYIRMRCEGKTKSAALSYVRVDGLDMMVRTVFIACEAFADYEGLPIASRKLIVSPDPLLDDSSDGVPIDWTAFGEDKLLRLGIAWTVPDEYVHIILTVATNQKWPFIEFKQKDEPLRPAEVVDYWTREPKPEIKELR